MPSPIPELDAPFLALAAEVLDDLERVRIANENRLRQLTRTETDADGEERGFGLDESHPDVARLAALVGDLARAEHQAELNLARLLRQHSLGAWIKSARGIGEKQGARLLAAIGDPYWNGLHGRPRTVSELWAYAGYHTISAGQGNGDAHRHTASGTSVDQRCADTQGGPVDGAISLAPRRARGQRANWSADAKMRCHLIAVSIVKAGGPYREVYDATRAHYRESVHPASCVRCGPAGKPAAAGSRRSDGHCHAIALRKVCKIILRDLWRAARDVHAEREAGAA